MLFAWSSAWSPFERLRDEMNRLFERPHFGRWMLPGWMERRIRFPRVNLTETDEAVFVECELPGVKSEDIDISVEGGELTIRGERKAPQEAPAETYHRRERGCGPFERVVELPAQVDVDKVEAKLTNGVLDIKLPKHPGARPRHVEVKAT